MSVDYLNIDHNVVSFDRASEGLFHCTDDSRILESLHIHLKNIIRLLGNLTVMVIN